MCRSSSHISSVRFTFHFIAYMVFRSLFQSSGCMVGSNGITIVIFHKAFCSLSPAFFASSTIDNFNLTILDSTDRFLRFGNMFCCLFWQALRTSWNLPTYFFAGGVAPFFSAGDSSVPSDSSSESPSTEASSSI